MTDIRNGVYAGKTVTVHDTEINFNGWRGTGYLILDPNTGAGAYMIGGGLDGGFIALLTGISQGLALSALGIAITTAIITLGPLAIGFIILISILLLALIFISVLMAESTFNDYQNNCREYGYAMGAAITGVIAVGFFSAFAGIFAAIFGIGVTPVVTPKTYEGTVDCANN